MKFHERAIVERRRHHHSGRTVLGGLIAATLLASMPRAAAQTQPPPLDLRRDAAPFIRSLCVVDASRGAPVAEARVRVSSGDDEWHPITATGSSGCTSLPVDGARIVAVRVTRLGFAPLEQRLDSSSQREVVLRLQPVATILASRTVTAARGVAGRATSGAAVRVDDARRFGAGGTAGLLAMLPFVQPRSARGELAVSLRGARTQQVVVTLDGLPLNDAATGVADLGDIPLAALASVQVEPGSAAVDGGPGAIGGVVSLQSADGTMATVRSGAFGERAVEGAWSGGVGGPRVRVGGSASSARNDFDYAAPVGDSSIRRPRANNDLARQSMFLSAGGSRARVTMLASRSTQGMVGPVNVRDYDDDRATTTRLFLRGVAQPGRTLIGVGARALTLDYRDPRRPVFNSEARVVSADVDARRRVAGALLSAGAGWDRLRGSGSLQQDRRRAFGSASYGRSVRALELSAGARVDALSGAGTLPSLSLRAQHVHGGVQLAARLEQAFRAPTLYDLYFGSPQRLDAAALDPERVRYDAELSAGWTSGATEGAQRSAAAPSPRETARARVGPRGAGRYAHVALFARETRDAIVWFPGNFGWSPANVGVERAHGVEGNLGVAGERGAIRAWATGYRSELGSGALRIPMPYVPTVAAGSHASAVIGALQLGAVARWMGERPYTVGPRDPRFNLPAVMLLDAALSATHRLSPATELLVVLALNNLTDQSWQSVRGFPASTRAWSLSLSLLPAHTP